MVNTEIRLILFFAAKDGEALHNQHARPGADCGSAHEFLIAKFRLKLKKVARPFRYDLNQIPYDYTMEVTNRFKGIDLVDRMPKELGTEVHNTVHKAVTKTIPKNKKCKAQWLSEEALQIVEERREAKGRGEGKDIHNSTQISREQQGEIRKLLK